MSEQKSVAWMLEYKMDGETEVEFNKINEFSCGRTGSVPLYAHPAPDAVRQLIIKECISIAEKQKERLCEDQAYWSEHDFGYEMAVNDTSRAIKQFFGVEE